MTTPDEGEKAGATSTSAPNRVESELDAAVGDATPAFIPDAGGPFAAARPDGVKEPTRTTATTTARMTPRLSDPFVMPLPDPIEARR